MELREKIARASFYRSLDDWDEMQWKHMQERHRAEAYQQADAILAIPEIRDALARPKGPCVEREKSGHRDFRGGNAY